MKTISITAHCCCPLCFLPIHRVALAPLSSSQKGIRRYGEASTPIIYLPIVHILWDIPPMIRKRLLVPILSFLCCLISSSGIHKVQRLGQGQVFWLAGVIFSYSAIYSCCLPSLILDLPWQYKRH